MQALALCCLSLLACSDVEQYSLGEPAPSPPPAFELDAGAAAFREAVKYCVFDAGVTVDTSAGLYSLSPDSLLSSCAGLKNGPLDRECPLHPIVKCALVNSGLAMKYNINVDPEP